MQKSKGKERAHLLTNCFFFWMVERCGLGFKWKGGLGRGGLMRKGSLVNGQALSKRRSQYSLPEAKSSPSRHTHTHSHTHKNLQTQQFFLNPINQSPAPPYITYTTISTSCLSLQSKPTGEPVVLISPSVQYELNSVAQLQPLVQTTRASVPIG